MIVYDEALQTLVLHRKRLAGGEGDGRLATVDFGVFPLFEGNGQPLELEDRHFLDCMATGDRPLSDGQSGLEVIRVLERAQQQLEPSRQPNPKERP